MANVNALKALYEALGGDSADVAGMTLICDVINAIATLVTSGIGLLPDPSDANDGDVLTVVDGAWAAAALPTTGSGSGSGGGGSQT